MDPLSITVSCIALVSTVTKVSTKINGFVREVRDARNDLDSVTRELTSLKTVLEILSDDYTKSKGGAFPQSLIKQISGILINCGGVLGHIEESLEAHSSNGLMKGVKWSLSGRDDMIKLRSSLEAHKSALDIALDMVALSMARDIKADTAEIRNETAAIKDDTTQILAEIALLQARLPEDDRRGGNTFTLQRYLDNLTNYAETHAELSDDEADSGVDVDKEDLEDVEALHTKEPKSEEKETKSEKPATWSHPGKQPRQPEVVRNQITATNPRSSLDALGRKNTGSNGNTTGFMKSEDLGMRPSKVSGENNPFGGTTSEDDKDLVYQQLSNSWNETQHRTEEVDQPIYLHSLDNTGGSTMEWISETSLRNSLPPQPKEVIRTTIQAVSPGIAPVPRSVSQVNSQKQPLVPKSSKNKPTITKVPMGLYSFQVRETRPRPPKTAQLPQRPARSAPPSQDKKQAKLTETSVHKPSTQGESEGGHRAPISAPENLVHVTHVSYNSQTREYMGLPMDWQREDGIFLRSTNGWYLKPEKNKGR